MMCSPLITPWLQGVDEIVSAGNLFNEVCISPASVRGCRCSPGFAPTGPGLTLPCRWPFRFRRWRSRRRFSSRTAFRKAAACAAVHAAHVPPIPSGDGHLGCKNSIHPEPALRELNQLRTSRTDRSAARIWMCR
ncbi:hypothetical protein KCP70_10920 [Salmonella enterica subsp. enterica]|nr:hypothetical protein KCP70_10920 [Salmonella enterica subsp. enterica]